MSLRLRDLSPIEVSLSGAPKNKSEKFLLQKGGGALTEKTLMHEGGAWVLYSKGGTRLGLYPSEDAVAEREREVGSLFRLKEATKSTFGLGPATVTMWKRLTDKIDVEAPEVTAADPALDGYWDKAAVWMHGASEQEVKTFLGSLGLTENAETKGEGDKGDFGPSDYAYVPDPDKPSTWKLRLTSEPGGKPDPGIVGAAVAALGKGFRGNKVQVPAVDRSKIIARVRAAWKAANPDKDGEDMPPVLKGMAPFTEILASEIDKAKRVSGTMDADALYGVDNKDYGKPSKKAPAKKAFPNPDKPYNDTDEDDLYEQAQEAEKPQKREIPPLTAQVDKADSDVDEDGLEGVVPAKPKKKAKRVGPGIDSPEGEDQEQEDAAPPGRPGKVKAKHVEPGEDELPDKIDNEEDDAVEAAAKGKKTKAKRPDKAKGDEEDEDPKEEAAESPDEEDAEDEDEKKPFPGAAKPFKKARPKQAINPQHSGPDDDAGPANATDDTADDDSGDSVEADAKRHMADVAGKVQGVKKAARAKKGEDPDQEDTQDQEDDDAEDRNDAASDESDDDMVKKPQKKARPKQRIEPEDDDDLEGQEDDGDEGPPGQEYFAEDDTADDTLGEDVEADNEALHEQFANASNASRKLVKAKRKKGPQKQVDPSSCDPATDTQGTTTVMPGDMGGRMKSEVEMRAKRGTSVDAPRDDGSDGADETANGVNQGEGETPGEYRDDLPKEQANAQKRPRRSKAIVASTDVLSAMQKSAASRLDEGDFPGAQRIMLIGKNLKRLLPEGGFIVMDPDAPVPVNAPVEGLGSFVRFDDLAPNAGFVQDIQALRSLVTGVPIENVNESVVEPVKSEAVPGVPGVKGEDEGATIVDAFARVVSATMDNKSLSREDKLATIQDAINAFAPSVVKLVESTTPAKEQDYRALLKSMVEEEFGPLREAIASLQAAGAQVTKGFTPNGVPVSKSLRPAPGMVEEVKPAGPMKIEDLVRRSMGLTNRNGY